MYNVFRRKNLCLQDDVNAMECGEFKDISIGDMLPLMKSLNHSKADVFAPRDILSKRILPKAQKGLLMLFIC